MKRNLLKNCQGGEEICSPSWTLIRGHVSLLKELEICSCNLKQYNWYWVLLGLYLLNSFETCHKSHVDSRTKTLNQYSDADAGFQDSDARYCFLARRVAIHVDWITFNREETHLENHCLRCFCQHKNEWPWWLQMIFGKNQEKSGTTFLFSPHKWKSCWELRFMQWQLYFIPLKMVILQYILMCFNGIVTQTEQPSIYLILKYTLP